MWCSQSSTEMFLLPLPVTYQVLYYCIRSLLQAKCSYENLVAAKSKGSSSFKEVYGSCLVTLQDTLQQLRSVHSLLSGSLSESSEEEDEEDTSNIIG